MSWVNNHFYSRKKMCKVESCGGWRLSWIGGTGEVFFGPLKMPNSFAFFIDIVKMSKWGLNKCDDDSDASSLKSSYHVHGGL